MLLNNSPDDVWKGGYVGFSASEMSCKCGCKGLPKHSFMVKIVELRKKVGYALRVSSGFRCPEYNVTVSMTGSKGPHTTGLAADFSVSRKKAYDVLKAAFELGFTGIGVAQSGVGRFIHLDIIPEGRADMPRRTLWSY